VVPGGVKTTMNDDNAKSDWIVSNLNSGLTRRRVLAGSATVVGGGTALALGATGTGRASVSVDDVSVSDATFEAESVDPIADVTVAFAYAYDAPTEVAIELLVGETTVASEQLRTSQAEYEGRTELSGRVLDADKWSASDFAVERGEIIEREVTVGVRFTVIDGGTVVAEDSAEDISTVVVESPLGESYARVGLTGEITNGE